MMNIFNQSKELSIPVLRQLIKTERGSDVFSVSPNVAKWVLENLNKHNRTISSRKVSHYAKSMHANDWQVNGESIKFSNDGALLDGQHRLLAICETATAVNTFVTFGLARDSFQTMDTGRARHGGDVLKISGYSSYSNVLAATAKFIINFHAGIYSSSGSSVSKPSNQDVLNFVNNTPNFYKFVQHGMSLYSAGGKFMGSSSLFIGMYYIAYLKHPEVADAFFTQCSTMIGLSKNSPVLLLMKAFEKMGIGRRRSTFKAKIECIVRAFNAQVQSKNISRVSSIGKIPPIK